MRLVIGKMNDGVVRRLIANLKRSYANSSHELPSDIDVYLEFVRSRGLSDGEVFFVPEKWFYRKVLGLLGKNDVVFDVGAGDLRFDLLMAQKVRKVYAVEVDPITLSNALRIIGYWLPRNIIPICANALDVPLPNDVTTITILMIHRTWRIPEKWKQQARIIYTRKDGVKVIERKTGKNHEQRKA